MASSGALSAFPAAALIFLPLSSAPPGLLRLPPLVRSLLLALRPWGLQLTLYSTRLLPLIRAPLRPLLLVCRAWLLPLLLVCRAPLLRRGLDRD